MKRDYEQESLGSREIAELNSFPDIKGFFETAGEVYGWTADKVLSALAQFLASGSDGYVFGIKEKGRVIAGREARLRRSKGRTYAFTLHKFVLPKFEGQGLAQMVSKKMEDELRQLGCEYVVCLVSRSNARAERSIVMSGYRKSMPFEYWDVDREFASDEVYIKFLE